MIHGHGAGRGGGGGNGDFESHYHQQAETNFTTLLDDANQMVGTINRNGNGVRCFCVWSLLTVRVECVCLSSVCLLCLLWRRQGMGMGFIDSGELSTAPSPLAAEGDYSANRQWQQNHNAADFPPSPRGGSQHGQMGQIPPFAR